MWGELCLLLGSNRLGTLLPVEGELLFCGKPKDAVFYEKVFRKGKRSKEGSLTLNALTITKRNIVGACDNRSRGLSQTVGVS